MIYARCFRHLTYGQLVGFDQINDPLSSACRCSLRLRRSAFSCLRSALRFAAARLRAASLWLCALRAKCSACQLFAVDPMPYVTLPALGRPFDLSRKSGIGFGCKKCSDMNLPFVINRAKLVGEPPPDDALAGVSARCIGTSRRPRSRCLPLRL